MPLRAGINRLLICPTGFTAATPLRTSHAKAQQLLALQRAVGVGTCRVLIKIATPWLAIQAAATRGAY